jgi:hypothetical protein
MTRITRRSKSGRAYTHNGFGYRFTELLLTTFETAVLSEIALPLSRLRCSHQAKSRESR